MVNNEACIIFLMVEALLVELLMNNFISIPTNSKNVLKNLAIVEDETGLCRGAYDVINCSLFPD